MRRAAWLLAVAAVTGLAACEEEIVCRGGERVCAGRCVDTSLDAENCGVCGVTCGDGEACKAGACTDCASACGDGQTCEGGVCKAAVYVACFATDEVVGVKTDLSAVGPAADVDDGPMSLAWLGDRLWAAHGATMPTLVGFTPGVDGSRRHTLEGDYLNAVHASGSLLYATTHSRGTLAVLDPDGGVRDEVALGEAGVEVNPRGVALAGTHAVVALYGSAFTPEFGEGQELVVVDVSGSASCTHSPCATVSRRISLDVPPAEGTPGAYDEGGFPFPADVAVIGTRALVSLANLKDSGGYYGTPAGHGRLAVVDTASAAAASFVDLGAGCTNPGALFADGTTVWVSCGGSGAVVPVDVSGATPVVGTPISLPIVPGAVVSCGGALYVGDQYSGQVARVSTSGGEPTTSAVCTGGTGFDWAAALACGAVSP